MACNVHVPLSYFSMTFYSTHCQIEEVAMTSRSKSTPATISELKVAYDEARNKKYKKGKFLGKVCSVLQVSVCTSLI